MNRFTPDTILALSYSSGYVLNYETNIIYVQCIYNAVSNIKDLLGRLADKINCIYCYNVLKKTLDQVYEIHVSLL